MSAVTDYVINMQYLKSLKSHEQTLALGDVQLRFLLAFARNKNLTAWEIMKAKEVSRNMSHPNVLKVNAKLIKRKFIERAKVPDEEKSRGKKPLCISALGLHYLLRNALIQDIPQLVRTHKDSIIFKITIAPFFEMQTFEGEATQAFDEFMQQYLASICRRLENVADLLRSANYSAKKRKEAGQNVFLHGFNALILLTIAAENDAETAKIIRKDKKLIGGIAQIHDMFDRAYKKMKAEA